MSACANFYLDDIGGGYLALGFFIGLIVGFIPFFFCFWILFCYRKFKIYSFDMACLRNIHSKRSETQCFRHFSYLNCMEDPDNVLRSVEKVIKEEGVGTRKSPYDEGENGPKRSKRRKSDKRKIEFLDPSNILVELKLLENGAIFNTDRDLLPMIDAITQATEAAGDLELSCQEERVAQQAELQLWRNRLIAFAGLCGSLLGLMLSRGLINDRMRTELRQNQINRLKDAKEKLDAEFKTRRDAVAEDKELSRAEKQTATDAIDQEYGPQLGKQLLEEASNFERDIRRLQGMDPDDADRLLVSLKEGQARLEQKLADQRLRAAAVNAEKMAERRRKLAEQKVADKEVAYDLVNRLDARREQLEDLVDGRQLTEAQARQALADYKKDLLRQKEAFEKSYHDQQEVLRLRMKEARRKKLMGVESEAANHQMRLASRVDAGTITDTEVFIQEFERALDSGEKQKEAALTELDDTECRKLESLRQELAKNKDAAEDEIDESSFMHLEQMGLSEDEIRRLLAKHKSQTEKIRREKAKEKKRQSLLLEEKLAQRKAKLADAIESQEGELASVKKGQELILKKALVFQVDLDESTKQQILDEHDRNMKAIGNNIQVSRMKLEASLESKLAARRANAARLKKKAYDARLALDEGDKSALDKLDADLARKLDKNSKKMEAESRKGLKKLRDDLAWETDEALRAQEETMNQIIGRLQTGRARRRGILTGQERLLRDLGVQLEEKLAGRVRGADGQGLDQVMQNYENQVVTVAQKLERDRRLKEKQMEEEMQRRKLDKKEEVQEAVDKEEKQSVQALKTSGHGRIAKFVMDSVLDTKYRNSIMDLNEEMRMEFRKEQEKLDRDMEEELKAELEEQRRHLFGKLTALTDFSPEEIKDMVDKAGRTAGVDRHLSKKLTKEFVDMVEESRGSFQSSRSRGSRRIQSRIDEETE